MGNTYSEVLQESEQRWVAERANIMATIENQCSSERNHEDRKQYAIPLRSRRGAEDLYLQIEVNSMATWKTQRSSRSASNNDDNETRFLYEQVRYAADGDSGWLAVAATALTGVGSMSDRCVVMHSERLSIA